MDKIETDAAMALAFDHAPVGLVLTENRVIRACNHAFANLVGRARADLAGLSFRALYDTEEEFQSVRDIGLKSLLDHGTYSDERLVRHRGGDRTWCRFRARTLTPDDPLRQIVMSFAPISPAPEEPALTPRERDVVTGLSRGETSKQIARRLGLSPRSVEDVRARLLRKFSVKNAGELVARLTGPRLSG